MSVMSATRPYSRKAACAVTHDFVGHLFTYLAEAPETGGALTVLDVVVRKGGEPPAHIHTREDEAFYVLEGRFTFIVGDETIEADAGTFVWLPRGVAHTFSIDEDGARALVLATPGGMEATFRAFSAPISSLELPPIPADPPVMEMVAMDRCYGVIYPGIPEGLGHDEVSPSPGGARQ